MALQPFDEILLLLTQSAPLAVIKPFGTDLSRKNQEGPIILRCMLLQTRAIVISLAYP